MKVFELLYVSCALAFYRRALAEIHPMHPDIAHILLRQHELDARYRRLCA